MHSHDSSTDVLEAEMTILLVEDNPAHAELIKRGFEDHPIPNEIVHVADGQAAVDYLFSGHEVGGEANRRPDVVLLDLRLPKLDGFEVLRRIRGSDSVSRLPVVVLSSSEAEQDVGRAYDGHANSYIVKPLEFGGFAELMTELGRYWLARNQSPWA